MRGSGGQRIEWGEIPDDVRAAVDQALGSPVVEARNQSGGFSPGLAARCRLADGRRVFIKAVSSAQNLQAPRIHRREAEVASLLPATVPAPRLRHVHDDGEWVVLVFDEVDGSQPDEPWRWDQLEQVIRGVAVIGEHQAPAGLQTAADRHAAAFQGWRRLSAGDGDVDRLDEWAVRNLDRLADIESRWEAASAGSALLHADLRTDNVLLPHDGGVAVVDWPWACAGPAFVDLVFLLPSVGLGGGPRPADVVESLGLFDDVDHDALVAVAVALHGFFQRSALDDPPLGLPQLRRFQQAQADVAQNWVRELIDRPVR